MIDASSIIATIVSISRKRVPLFINRYKKPYNILFLDFTTFIGGTEISTLLLLKHMDRREFNPFFVLQGKGPYYDRIVKLGVPVTIIPLNQLKVISLIKYIKTVWDLSRFIRKNRIDIVVCTLEPCNQYGLPAARLNRIPIACHTRNLIPDFRSFWRTLLHFPDVLIANSKATAESYIPFVRKHQKVEVVYNGVDLEEYSPSLKDNTIRKRYGIGDNKFLIGMIGRISRPKRQDIFLKTIAEVVKFYPDVCAFIVGDTRIDRSEQYLEELHQLVKKFELEDKVIFTGFINDMKGLYASLDLLVLPSQAEPFGRVLIEMMAMGKPVVATKSGGAVEIVEHEVTGLLIPPDDEKSMSKAILKIINDKQSAKKMGNAGRKRVENLFSIKTNVEETQKKYMEVLNDTL